MVNGYKHPTEALSPRAKHAARPRGGELKEKTQGAEGRPQPSLLLGVQSRRVSGAVRAPQGSRPFPSAATPLKILPAARVIRGGPSRAIQLSLAKLTFSLKDILWVFHAIDFTFDFFFLLPSP